MKRPSLLQLLPIFLATLAMHAGCTSYSRNADGIRYFDQARYNDAMTAFQAALASDPENADIYYNIASTYHQSAKVSMQMGQPAVAQQQYDEAVRNYQLCLTRNANHTAAYRGLASLYMECANAEAAFNLLLAWFQGNPVSPDPKIELARLYQEYAQIRLIQGSQEDYTTNTNSAATLLNQAISVDPNNFRAFRALGYMKEQNSDYVGAISDYRRSLQANPNQKDLETRIAALEQGAGYVLPNSGSGATLPGTSAPVWSSAQNGGATVYGSTGATAAKTFSPF